MKLTVMLVCALLALLCAALGEGKALRVAVVLLCVYCLVEQLPEG